MPIIHFEVIPLEKLKLFQVHRAQKNPPKRFNIMEDKLAEGCDLMDSKQQRYFMVPLYITDDKDRLKVSLMQGLVTHIPLKSENAQTTEFWVKRGTALVCRTY
jgi:hypothetical protein